MPTITTRSDSCSVGNRIVLCAVVRWRAEGVVSRWRNAREGQALLCLQPASHFGRAGAVAIPEVTATDGRGPGIVQIACWRWNGCISADSNVESLPHSPARHGGLRPFLGSRTAIAAKGGRRHFCDMSAGFCTPPEVASPQKNVFRRSFGQFPPRSVKFSCKKT